MCCHFFKIVRWDKTTVVLRCHRCLRLLFTHFSYLSMFFDRHIIINFLVVFVFMKFQVDRTFHCFLLIPLLCLMCAFATCIRFKKVYSIESRSHCVKTNHFLSWSQSLNLNFLMLSNTSLPMHITRTLLLCLGLLIRIYYLLLNVYVLNIFNFFASTMLILVAIIYIFTVVKTAFFFFRWLRVATHLHWCELLLVGFSNKI